jgi:hypothetical protein
MFPRRIAGLLVLTPLSLLACSGAEPKKSTSAHGAGGISPAAASSVLRAPQSKQDNKKGVARATAPLVPEMTGDTRAEPPSMPAPALAGAADLDPHNDAVVAPPEIIPDCEALLTARDVKFAPATLPVKRSRSGRECGAPQVVVYHGVKGGARYSPAPILSCGMALALASFEPALQGAAEAAFGQRVARLRHIGTYNCRDMARFELVSEHSYANAIDISELVLANGRTISVERHFGRPSGEPRGPEGHFLRTLARGAYDNGIFSCVITEFFDSLHRNHIHVDLARYRVDGTR